MIGDEALTVLRKVNSDLCLSAAIPPASLATLIGACAPRLVSSEWVKSHVTFAPFGVLCCSGRIDGRFGCAAADCGASRVRRVRPSDLALRVVRAGRQSL